MILLCKYETGPILYTAAGSHPVLEARGSQGTLYSGQIQKFHVVKTIGVQKILPVITIRKKRCLTYQRQTIL